MVARVLPVLALFLVACGEDPAPTGCESAADCDSGFICVNGACALVCVRDIDCDDLQVCSNGVCVAARAGDCGDDSGCVDDNPCTEDICGVGGVCVHTNGSGACDDGDLCTSGDVCSDGECTGSAYGCDDSDDCTVDTCDGNGGCIHQFVCDCLDAADCDDNDICTSDTCDDNTCVYTGIQDCCVNAATDCDASEPFCRNNTCVECTSPSDCSDGIECTEDVCNAQFVCENPAIADCCLGAADCADNGNGRTVCDVPNKRCVECLDNPDCEDSDACTVDVCQVGNVCYNEVICSCVGDEDCTGDDTPVCIGGTCRECRVHGDCDDGNACTTEECQSNDCVVTSTTALPACCNSSAECAGMIVDLDYCVGNTCVECEFSSQCADDGLFCNGLEECVGGSCTSSGSPCGSEQPDCDDVADACSCNGTSCPSGEFCDSGSGTCFECLDDIDCNDGDFCNGDETCDAGHCVTGTLPCGAHGCDDNACTVSCNISCGFCKPTTHECIGGPYAGFFCEAEEDCCSTAVCNDLTPCTTGDTCIEPSCTGPPIVCETAPDGCHDDAGICIDGDCEYPKLPDGTVCGVGGECIAGVCIGGGTGTDCRFDPCTDSSVCCGDYPYCNQSEGCCVAGPGSHCP